MPGGVVISRETGELLYVNPYMVAFYDCASEEELREYLADNMYTMVRPEDRESLRQRLQKEEKGRELYYRMRYTVVTKKGRIRHVDAVDRLVVTPEGERLHYGFSLPMSETGVEQDAMTGTRRFLSYASQFLEMYQEGMAMPALNLIFFNVERFKLYNIKYGIEAGNQLIARCAAVLQQVFANDFVFCIADDRFAILTDALRVRDRVQEVREILRQEYSDRVVAFHFGGYRIIGSPGRSAPGAGTGPGWPAKASGDGWTPISMNGPTLWPAVWPSAAMWWDILTKRYKRAGFGPTTSRWCGWTPWSPWALKPWPGGSIRSGGC